MFVVIWKSQFLFPYLKTNVLFENLLTILFSDFVSFGFSTTDIVI